MNAAPSRKSQAKPRHHGDAGLYAALDLGTNNCRLLVASMGKSMGDQLPAGLKVIDSFSRIVRLGEGVSKTGKFSEEAMARTLAALNVCKKKLNKYELKALRLVATEACRKSANTKEFLSKVKAALDLDIEVISNEEEARLAFLGCSSLLAESAHRAIVFDIGGGSTELMWIDVQEAHDRNRHGKQKKDESNGRKIISDWLSIDSGVMNLADRFGGNNFADMAYTDMVNYIVQRIKPFDEANNISENLGNSKVQMLSTSGTVTTLAAIHLGLPKYDRTKVDGLKLKVSDIRLTIQKLLSMRPFERFNHPCIGHERADFILSGCAVFDAISCVWPTGEITIADRGVREGIIISLMQQHDQA